MCDGYGIDIWKELIKVVALLEEINNKLQPKKKAGRPKGSKNANTQAPKKRDKK